MPRRTRPEPAINIPQGPLSLVDTAEWVLSVSVLLGRIEVLPLLVWFAPYCRR
jgi:Trk-type K+ transport system membrane component